MQRSWAQHGARQAAKAAHEGGGDVYAAIHQLLAPEGGAVVPHPPIPRQACIALSLSLWPT